MQNSDVPPPAPIEAPKAARFELASRRLRLLNVMIDIGCCSMVALVLAANVASFTGHDLEHLLQGPAQYPFVTAGILLYYTTCESLLGRTMGKFVTGTRIVTTSGERPSFERVLLRTLVRLVPLEHFSFLAGKPIGWHDRWSGTRVVRS